MMGMKKMMILLALAGNACMGSEGISLAIQHVHKSCDNNMATACFELGELYREGAGVDRNLSKAENYYSKACDGGFDKGCFQLEKLKENKSK